MKGKEKENKRIKAKSKKMAKVKGERIIRSVLTAWLRSKKMTYTSRSWASPTRREVNKRNKKKKRKEKKSEAL